ncbi:DNA-processing protein DprA [Porcipelethomonas sp.]|uniref:DNA-processing protein DprA n=1 Tax=Porcipelethomonas sp. TaxID=2981675 RepID=UPI003EF1CF3E
MNNLQYWLWFVMAFRPGNERIWEMITPFQDVKKAYEAVWEGNHPSMNSKEKTVARTTHIEQCDSIIKYCEEKGYRIITFEDDNYPPLLRNIYNPPAVLFCMGDIENFNSRPAVACVGTRRPSVYSAEITERICSELAKREFAVVSGFALGLDSAAHKGVLKADGCTAAVLACGLDVNYPKENEKAKKLIAHRGIVITEYLPGTHPDRYCFHVRNRIISGMCFGTLVTEADEKSGALITASHAAEQGRSVFCIPPGDIFDKRYSGVIKYLRDGAVPVFSHLDILYEYYTSEYFRNHDSIMKWPELYGENDILKRDSRTEKKTRAKSRDSGLKEESITCENQMVYEQLLDEMTDEQQLVVTCLKECSMHSDEIAQASGIDSFQILAVLTELEIMGAAELQPDNKYRLL